MLVTSGWMSFLNNCFLFFLLVWSSVITGAEGNSKQKCRENLMTIFRNTSEYPHDYFGKPLNKDEMFKGSGAIKIFHFKVINKTIQSTDKTCCQWNSEGCYIFVWFRKFYYLLISPIDLRAYGFLRQSYFLEETYPQSICVGIPSQNHETLITLTENVSLSIIITELMLHIRMFHTYYSIACI